MFLQELFQTQSRHLKIISHFPSQCCQLPFNFGDHVEFLAIFIMLQCTCPGYTSYNKRGALTKDLDAEGGKHEHLRTPGTIVKIVGRVSVVRSRYNVVLLGRCTVT